MSNFTAIDFETADGPRNSICQVGLVIVEQCKIIERITYLVRPPDNKYSERCIAVHGITPDKTEQSDPFNVVFEKINQYIAGRNVVAHNAQFDISCLEKTLLHYGLPVPLINWFCTRKIYGMSLKDACAANGITYNAHDALSDAEACALLMIKDIKK